MSSLTIVDLTHFSLCLLSMQIGPKFTLRKEKLYRSESGSSLASFE